MGVRQSKEAIDELRSMTTGMYVVTSTYEVHANLAVAEYTGPDPSLRQALRDLNDEIAAFVEDVETKLEKLAPVYEDIAQDLEAELRAERVGMAPEAGEGSAPPRPPDFFKAFDLLPPNEVFKRLFGRISRNGNGTGQANGNGQAEPA